MSNSTSVPESRPLSSTHARSSTPSEQHSENQWGAVLLVALATFMVVAAEMMPVGLLTPIGATLAQSEGTIGLSLTITGLVAAATAPFVPVLTSRIDRRTTLIVLMVLVAVANSLTAVSPNFAVMAGARILLGVSMGGVWALAASLAPKLVKPRSVGLGTTIIFSGIAVASVLGVPAGAYIAAAFGWNATFWVLATAATMIALAMIVILPKMPPGTGIPLSSLSAAFRNPGVRVGLAITAFIVTAHFAAYIYVRPALESFSGLGAALIGTMLLIYGILGIIGNFIAGPTAARNPKAVVTILSLGIAATLALFPSLATSTFAAALLMAVWGLFYGGLSVSTQAWIAEAAPTHREAVAALWVSIFNASIALGSFTGGQIYDGAGPNFVFWITAGTATLAFLLAIYPKVGPGK